MRRPSLSPLLRVGGAVTANWRALRAGACLLAAVLALVLAAEAAKADHVGGRVELVDRGIGTCSETQPCLPTGYAESGPGHGQITLRWTPATTGAEAYWWLVYWSTDGGRSSPNFPDRY